MMKLDNKQEKRRTSFSSDSPDVKASGESNENVLGQRRLGGGIGFKGQSLPVLKQMGKIASHQEWVNHVIPPKVLHDGLN